MATIETILQATRGLISAPAGCGKTQLIVDSLKQPQSKPVLVLTHTTAGVAALKHRLKKSSVPSKNYRLATIAGWAINLARMFPARCGNIIDTVKVPDYKKIQHVVSQLCISPEIAVLLKATYSRLLVDEYQDCSRTQHSLLVALSHSLPTAILGDPMQAIFGFGDDPLPNWNSEVSTHFPLLGGLSTPWRWINANSNELGKWILNVRDILNLGQKIDLRTCASHVHWHQLSGNLQQDTQAQLKVQYSIFNGFGNSDSFLVIGDSINVQSRHNYAKGANGLTVVEPVDLRDILSSAKKMDGIRGSKLLSEVIDLASTMIANVNGPQLLKRLDSIKNGSNRIPATSQEEAALNLLDNGGYKEASEFLKILVQDKTRKLYRHSAYSIIVDALDASAADWSKNLYEITATIREQRRHSGRRIPNRAIGSTLLLKGLESDHVLILNADQMNAQHLYVALSRGAKTVNVFSSIPIVPV